MIKVGIIGCGHVGTAMKQLFVNAYLFDEPKKIGTRDELNMCDLSFVCVPTPMAQDGSCDTTIVEQVLGWDDTPIIFIRSTVPIGFTERMKKKTGKKIIFQPEYYGETIEHPFADLKNQRWITLGGDKDDSEIVVSAYQKVLTSDLFINMVDSKTAELAKYMENCFFATKVTFCNEFYDLAMQMGVNYTELRETWLLDPRMGRSHTFVYSDNRGYGGACLPKDISAIVYQGEKVCDMTLLKSVIEKNDILRKKMSNVCVDYEKI